MEIGENGQSINEATNHNTNDQNGESGQNSKSFSISVEPNTLNENVNSQNDQSHGQQDENLSKKKDCNQYSQSLQNGKTRRLDPIHVKVNKDALHLSKSKETIIEHIEETLSLEHKIDRITICSSDSFMIYPTNQETVNEITDPGSKFFPQSVKTNLAIENTAIVLTNISLNELEQSEFVKKYLASMGIKNMSKLGPSHDPSKNVVKAYCDTETIRKTALEFEIEIPLGNTKKTIYTEPCIRPPIQCNKCKTFGHKAIKCEEKSNICAKCSKSGHEAKECQNQSTRCINCMGNHNAYSRECKSYKTIKDAAVTQALLKIGIRTKRGKCITDENAPKESFTKVCSFAQELSEIKKSITNLSQAQGPNQIECNKIFEEVKMQLAESSRTQEESNKNNQNVANQISAMMTQMATIIKEECQNIRTNITKETDAKIMQLATETESEFSRIKNDIAEIKEAMKLPLAAHSLSAQPRYLFHQK